MTELPGVRRLTLLAIALHVRLVGADAEHRERGDVPGWVLITVMTAGLVTVLWALAGSRLQSIFDNALNISGPGSGG